MAESKLNISERLRNAFRPAGVPVLMYHGISGPGVGPIPARDRKFWITYGKFSQHLERIRLDGYRVGPLRELWWLSSLSAKTPLMAITFDDGHATDYTVAFPLLHDFGFRTDFFINTATVGSPGFLTWEQIGEMHRAGMSIQSHSHDHVDLARLPMPTLRRQLRHSKRMIEDRLGHPVELLSAPYGLVNGRVFAAAMEEGYRAVCTSRSWPARLGGRRINRVSIHADTTSHEFEGLVACALSSYAARSVRDALLYLPKQILLRLNPSILTVEVLGGQQ